MSGTVVTAAVPVGARSVVVRGHAYPVLLPSLRDPRLHVASVVVTLQVLGQTVLGFDLSIAQILVTLLTCAVIECLLALWQRGVIMWPASALLTANGTAFILRVPGTEHGQWWSMRGWYIFATVGALGVLSKWAVRFAGRQVFNPSNVALVVAFLVLGFRSADPQDLWWGPLSPGLALTLVVILTGGVVIMSRLRMLEMAIGFWVALAVAVGALSASGHCIHTRWSLTPVCDGSFWWVVVLSPEVLIFALFMITDPKTTPQGRLARIVYGAAIGLLAALAVAPQRNEFATKVAILGSLTLACLVRSFLLPAVPALRGLVERVRRWATTARTAGPRVAAWRAGLVTLGLVAFVGVVVAAGGSTRLPPPDGPALASTTRRPLLVLPEGTMPTVAVGPGVRRLDHSIDGAVAQWIGTDLATDLLIERQAVRSGDLTLAGSAAVEPRLSAIAAAMQPGAQPSPSVFVATYAFRSMTIVLVKDPGNPQAVPRLGVRAEGSRKLPDRPAVDFRRTFIVVPVGDHYLVVDDVPA